MDIDHLSDIHINNWVSYKSPEYVQRKLIREFLIKLLPEKPSRILIVSGDIGHDNDQNIILFEILSEYYEYVLWTEGNHDLYLIGDADRKRYGCDSFGGRLKEMIELSSKVRGNHYLSGTIEIEGAKIGGFPMWYDNAYGVQVLGRASIFIDQLWRQWMPCRRLIYTSGNPMPKFDWLAYAASQKENLEKHYRNCAVIFSHVSPDWSQIKLHHRESVQSTFFHFDGREILKNCKGKTWIFGHTHDVYDYYSESGCHMLANPLGYPHETGSFNDRDIEGTSIRTFTI